MNINTNFTDPNQACQALGKRSRIEFEVNPIPACFERGDGHSSLSKKVKREDEYNLLDAVAMAEKQNKNQKEPIFVKDLISMKTGPKDSELQALLDQENVRIARNNQTQIPVNPLPINNPNYLLTNPFLFNNPSRCLISNNNIFSHIPGLEFSTYGPNENLRSLKDRLQVLKNQLKFSAKYKTLTFRLCLLAFMNQKLTVVKDKTMAQGSYAPSGSNNYYLNRSFDLLDVHKGGKKTTDECHISCVPNLLDNSNMSVDLDELIDEINQLELKNIKNYIQKKFKNLPTDRRAAIVNICEIYKKESEKNFKRDPFYLSGLFENRNNKLGVKFMSCQNFSKKLHSYIEEKKRLPSPISDDLKKLESLFENDLNAIIDLHANVETARAAKTNAEKEFQANPKDSNKKQLFDDARKKLALFQETVNKNEENYLNNLYVLVLDNINLLKEFLKEKYPASFDTIESHANWLNSNEANEAKLNKILCNLIAESSIIPLNSILGSMLSATIGMPSEINHSIDAATDKIHVQVANLLTEFSQIENPTQEIFDTYLNKYMQMQKNAFALCANNYIGESLEEIIDNTPPNSMQSMHDFIQENIEAIADYSLRHTSTENSSIDDVCKYDYEFEKEVMGKKIDNPDILTQPILEFDFCNNCWIKI